jgi:hypothetical protein
MTATALHEAPRWRAVAVEQLRAVGLFTRGVGGALIALFGVMLLVVINGAMRTHEMEVNHTGKGTMDLGYAPQISSLFAALAFLYAFSVWHDEDPSRRSYHWLMAVRRDLHTLTKVLAGWIWVLLATVAGLLATKAMGSVTSLITGHPQPPYLGAWWTWLVPFTSVTVAYLLSSAFVVGTRRPLIWMAGVVAIYIGLLSTLLTLGYPEAATIVGRIYNGHYGLVAALAGQVDWQDPDLRTLVQGPSRWLVATALWGGGSTVLLVAMARRRGEG